jgi:hypothetical protein
MHDENETRLPPQGTPNGPLDAYLLDTQLTRLDGTNAGNFRTSMNS